MAEGDVPQRSRSAPSYRITIDHGKWGNRFLSACFNALSLALGKAWWLLIGWWLDPVSQRKRNLALMEDVQANLNFLYSGGQPIVEKRPAILPFDYASARILLGNVYYRFTRGRGELNITLAPRHDPSRSHELSMVIAALDSAKLRPVGNDFASIGSAIRPRLEELESAFSENEYPEFKNKLP